MFKKIEFILAIIFSIIFFILIVSFTFEKSEDLIKPLTPSPSPTQTSETSPTTTQPSYPNVISSDNIGQLSEIYTFDTTKYLGHSSEIRSIKFSHNRSLLAAGTVDSQIMVWDTTSKKLKYSLNAPSLTGINSWWGIYSIAFSPDDKIIATTDNSVIELWNSKDGNLIKVLNGHTSQIVTADFCNTSDKIYSGGDQTVRIWDIAQGKEIKRYSGITNGVSEFYCSNDGSLSAFIGSTAGGSSPYNLVITMVKYWQTAYKITVPINWYDFNAYHYGLAFSPTNDLIALQTRRGIFLANPKTGQQLKGPEFDIRDSSIQYYHSPVVFSPDGKLLVYNSIDGKITIWDTLQQKDIYSFTGHNSFINSLDFSSDGSMIASGSNDGTVKLLGINGKK